MSEAIERRINNEIESFINGLTKAPLAYNQDTIDKIEAGILSILAPYVATDKFKVSYIGCKHKSKHDPRGLSICCDCRRERRLSITIEPSE